MTEEVRMARGAALATAAAAPVALGLAWWAAGSKGVLGAAFGLLWPSPSSRPPCWRSGPPAGSSPS